MVELFAVNTDSTFQLQFAEQHPEKDLEKLGRQRVAMPHCLLSWYRNRLNSFVSVEQPVIASLTISM